MIEEHKIELKTHTKIDQNLCGKLVELEPRKYAKVKFEAIEQMAVDEHGLIHGGYIFGAADFCAMATINEPNVVLASSKSRFLAPIKIGDIVIFESEVIFDDDKRQEVSVKGIFNNVKIFDGIFSTVVLSKHVLKLKPGQS